MSGDLSRLMVAVYWVYVLTFFVMGVSIWLRVERTNRLGMVAPLFSLIMFAFVHGLADAMPLLAYYRSEVNFESAEYLLVASILEAASFVFLLLFGLISFVEGPTKTRALYVLGLLGMLGVIVGLVLSLGEDMSQVDAAVHTLLGIPAGVAATAAFARAAYRCHVLGVRNSRNGAIIAAVGMGLYTIFAMIQPVMAPELVRVAGVPIQVHRVFAAMVITVGVGWMLERLALRSGD